MAVTSTFTPGIDEEVVLKDGANSKSVQAVILVSPTDGLPYAASGGGGGGAGDASAANQVITNTSLGATNEAAAGTDTATSGLSGLVKRLLQRVTTLIGLYPSALLSNRFATEPLGLLAAAKTLAFTGTTATIALETATTRVSLVCLTGDVCIRVYTGADQSAVTTDHYIQAGERIDVRCAASSKIAAIRAGTTSGTLRISELG